MKHDMAGFYADDGTAREEANKILSGILNIGFNRQLLVERIKSSLMDYYQMGQRVEPGPGESKTAVNVLSVVGFGGTSGRWYLNLQCGHCVYVTCDYRPRIKSIDCPHCNRDEETKSKMEEKIEEKPDALL